MDEKIKILLVDDHTLVREGFAKMLELESDMNVVGQAASCDEAISQVKKVNPDIILMDIRLPGTTGIEATKIIKEQFPKVEVIILSMYNEDEYIFEAIKAGAGGYVLKDISKEDLIRAIRVVYSGESLIQPALAKKVLKEFSLMAKETEQIQSKSSLRGLSDRELDVLKLVAEGRSNKEIADLLIIGETTVKAHLRSIFKKLEVNDRAQAVAYAMRKGLVN
jgi:DNA-binding NarL/FixJ family response regulator